MTALKLFLELFPNADITDRFGDYHTINFDEFEKAFDRLSTKIADRSIKFLGETTGSCPADINEYEKIDCDKLCGTDGRNRLDCSQCWEDYFADESNFTD